MKTNNKGYKLFESDKSGNLYPLFIDSRNIVPVGKWIPAENHPTKGFAPRPGWHVGLIPDAPWLKKADGSYGSRRFKHGQRVWCEVEYLDEIDYQAEAEATKKKCFTDRIPVNGCYVFRECGKGDWIISGGLKVVRILSEDERQEILKLMNYDESAAFEPYRQSFAKKGVATC